jgi:DNA polymerase I-like protein with 3'-5' exonuclease and polymerase domains
VFKVKWLDGMLLWKHATIEPEYDMDRGKRKSYGLKAAVAARWPEHGGYEEDVDYHSTDPENLAKLRAYNIKDTVFSLALVKHWWAQLTERQQRCALIESDALPMLAQANLEGMVVDSPAVRELEQYLTNVAATKLEILAPHGVTEQVVRSPMQLGALLYDVWKLPVLKVNTGKKTGKVSRATDKEVLHELSFVDPRAKHLREYREALNNRTKFATGILTSKAYNEDGRTHPLAIPFGTYTGRLTYASKQGRNKDERPIGFPLHQEKRHPMYRAAIVPPEGYTLMEFDASGQEYRWMAIISGDEAMLRLCLPGEDAHAYMGAAIAGQDYRTLQAAAKVKDSPEADLRQMGKVGNLSCCAEGTLVTTDRGLVPIEEVRLADLVWDGVDFVRHAGIVYQGRKETIRYAGLEATPDHLVLCAGQWVPFGEAAAAGHDIEVGDPAGLSGCGRASVGPLDGSDRRTAVTSRDAVRTGAMRVRHDEGGCPAVLGDRTVHAVQRLRVTGDAYVAGPPDRADEGGRALAEARERDAPAVHQLQRPILAQLRSAWDRVSVWLGARGRRVDQGASAARDIPAAGRGSHRQQRPLRAGEPATGHEAAEPRQPATTRVYDILDCGPRNRFVANGLIVHNCQYRVSARKLLVVARVQYDMPMTLPSAQHIHSTYRMVYPDVVTYWHKQVHRAKRQGYVETLAGRRVQLTGAWERETEWQMGSTAINYPVQGTGGDQKYLALSVLRPYLRTIGARFAWDLHDGIYFYVPDDKVKTAATTIKALLDNLPYQKAWGFSPPIPLPWDCKFGKSWGTLREFKE